MRIDGRKKDEMRKVRITRNYTKYAEGSVLMEMGDTKVICTASIEEKVPTFLKGRGEGWITCEYAMIPRATKVRKVRDSSRGKIDGRTMEIQRLIGRALRSVVDLDALGEKTIWIDCDVIQADGGTRTASITGAFVALVDAIDAMNRSRSFKEYPIKDFVSAVSVGISKEDDAILDLAYIEDCEAKIDMNLVMTSAGEFIEVQGTGEKRPFTRDELNILLDLGEKGNKELIRMQKEALKESSLLIKR